MHLRSYQVDGRTLRTGAANFSASGLKRQDNDLTNVPRVGIDWGLFCVHPSLWARPIPFSRLKGGPRAELVEYEQRMITGAFVLAIPDAVLLFAVGRAHARIHVEHDASRRTAS
jgi:hypothetical protein